MNISWTTYLIKVAELVLAVLAITRLKVPLALKGLGLCPPLGLLSFLLLYLSRS